MPAAPPDHPAGERPPPVFTLEAVNALLPRLRVLVHAQMGRRAEIERRLERLAKLTQPVASSSDPSLRSSARANAPNSIEINDGDPPEVRELKRDIAAHIERYQAGWREIEDTGAVLKDPRMGLLDFYGEVDGTRVWLCWKYDEEAVTHYHGIDEGFAGRKPIEPMMRRRHLN
jgi:hypothetical protein